MNGNRTRKLLTMLYIHFSICTPICRLAGIQTERTIYSHVIIEQIDILFRLTPLATDKTHYSSAFKLKL